MNTTTNSALAWKLTEELFRRPRPGLELSVHITHPFDGNYFAVSLMRRDRWEPLVELNLDGTSIGLRPVDSPRAPARELFDSHSYLEAILTHGVVAVADEAECKLGLPVWSAHRPPTTAPTLGVRLIAAVMQRRLFASHHTIADSGFFDGGGMSPCGVNAWVQPFREVYDRAQEALARDERRTAARRASRCWRLTIAPNEAKTVVLDLGTAEARATGNSVECVSLMRWYERNGRRLSPLVEWIVEHLE